MGADSINDAKEKRDKLFYLDSKRSKSYSQINL